MQIQSVNETAQMMQASIYLPGQPFHLPSDMKLEFSGHKTNDGEIDPQSCRILFYLDLVYLNETIIDMQIQKRSVSRTIYNDQATLLKRQSATFKPMLEDGLTSLDYKLSSITFKPIHEKEHTLRAC